MATTTVLNSDSHTIIIARGTWSATYPISVLSSWIIFLPAAGRIVPKQAAYVEDVTARKALAKHLGLSVSTKSQG